MYLRKSFLIYVYGPNVLEFYLVYISYEKPLLPRQGHLYVSSVLYQYINEYVQSFKDSCRWKKAFWHGLNINIFMHTYTLLRLIYTNAVLNLVLFIFLQNFSVSVNKQL